MDDGKKYLVCIILLLNECMQDVVKVQRTVPSSRVYVIMRVPKRVDFVCPRCDTSPCFTLSFFFFPCSLPPFSCSKTIYIKQKQKCLSTLANVRINIFSSPFSNPLYLGGLANVPPPHFPHTARGELLAWLNDLLAPTVITKLEQCGTGSVYCQIIDSIYGDLPMSRVKFNARMEYEYLDNFKILQKAFTRHKIEKVGCGLWVLGFFWSVWLME